jgi:hypothetical protein
MYCERHSYWISNTFSWWYYHKHDHIELHCNIKWFGVVIKMKNVTFVRIIGLNEPGNFWYEFRPGESQISIRGIRPTVLLTSASMV